MEEKQACEGKSEEQVSTTELLRIPRSFYLSPYLTCGECNSINFIDSNVVQKALVLLSDHRALHHHRQLQADAGQQDYDEDEDEEDDEEKDEGKVLEELLDTRYGLKIEALPRCPGCNRTHTWVVGALDLSSNISANAKERRKLRILQRKYAIRIQAIIRGIRGRAVAAELKRKKEEREALEYRSASLINAAARGRLDRRAAEVERSLRRIAGVHPCVLQEALRPKKGVKVFWYKRRQERDLLYRNYRLLVERTGNDPPLHRVEKNINLIAERIHAIECREATKVQCRVRGMIGRKVIRQYRVERGYLNAKYCAAVFRIQRCYRIWVAKRIRHAKLVEREKRRLNKTYATEKHKESLNKRATMLKQKVQSAYIVNHRFDTAGKVVLRYHDSVPLLERSEMTIKPAQKLFKWQQEIKEEKRRDREEEKQAEDFVLQRCQSNPAFKHYYKERLESTISSRKFTTFKKKNSDERFMLLRHHNQRKQGHNKK